VLEESWVVEMRTGGRADGRDELRNNRLLLCCEGARLLVLHSRSKAPERREGGGGCRCRAAMDAANTAATATAL